MIWNRKHHDARHLVDYASKTLFKSQPLAWQVFDPRHTNITDEKDFNEELSNLLQSPILYMNGHVEPKLEKRQIELLRRYVDEGGFIFAEACCGSPEFIKASGLMKEVFKDSQLVPMRPPITRSGPRTCRSILTSSWKGKPEREHIQCIEPRLQDGRGIHPQPLRRLLGREPLPAARRQPAAAESRRTGLPLRRQRDRLRDRTGNAQAA